MNRATQYRLTLCALLVALLSGCALTTANLDLAYKPEQTAKSPLSTIKPVVVQLQVEDKRLPDEQGRVGNKKNGFGATMAPIVSSKQPCSVLYDALKAELVNNGHTVVEAADPSAKVLLTVNLQRYWVDMNIHMWDIEVIGTLNSDVSLRSPGTDSTLFARPHNATHRESRQLATDSAFESVLNGVLAEYVRSFSRDPEVVDALRKATETGEEQKKD